MLQNTIYAIAIVLSVSALAAAVVYPIQVIKYYEYILKWSYSSDEKEEKKLNSYKLLAFAGISFLLFGGVNAFLWWVPKGLIDLSFSGTIAIILGVFAMVFLEELPQKLNNLKIFFQDLEKLRSDIRSQVEAKDIIITELSAKNAKLQDEIEELMIKNEDFKCDIEIANNQNELLKIMTEKNSTDDEN